MKNILSTLLVLFSITISRSQNLDNVKCDTKLSILNDRAFFNFPTGSKNEAREANIMAADPNANRETRISFVMDNMKLIFFAQELYCTSDNNFYAEVSKQPIAGVKTKVLTDKDGLISIFSTPSDFDTTKKAIFISGLLIKTKDNTVFRIDAYINPEAIKLKDGFIKLVEQTFQTVSNGTRTNNRSAREESVVLFGTKKSLKFLLPENYTISIDQKYDFQVIKFKKYNAFSDTDWVSLMVYMGNHPSFFYREYSFDESTSKKTTTNFLEKKVEWLNFYNAGQNTYLKEQIIPGDEIEKGLMIHIAMMSDKSSLVDELTKIIEKAKLVN